MEGKQIISYISKSIKPKIDDITELRRVLVPNINDIVKTQTHHSELLDEILDQTYELKRISQYYLQGIPGWALILVVTTLTLSVSNIAILALIFVKIFGGQ